jgi:CheY-like chemotaxis protein
MLALGAKALSSVNCKKILVIDDEALIREVVQNCLEDLAGWNVVTAQSASEGLTQAIAEQPDAILLDVMMPGIDGLTFLQLLRANPLIESIPVFLLTAKSEFTDPKWVWGLGLAGALAKPFDPYELIEAICTAFNWKTPS